MCARKATVSVEGAVAPGEALRFASVAAEVMRAPMYAAERRRQVQAGGEDTAPHIGTLREKRLHAAIKAYLCPDTRCHERPVCDLVRPEAGTAADTPGDTATDTATDTTAGTVCAAAGDKAGTKTPRMVADVFTGEEIFEVQTGGFYPLRDKIAWYLSHTDCRVTVVHPIAAVRYLSWIQPADGTVLSRRRSPKRGRVMDVAKELYWLSDFIGHPRFSIRLLLIELEEYRMADGWGRDGKRGSSRYERFPTALLGDVTLATSSDYATYFLPAALTAIGADGRPTPFTAADYARATGIRGKATYSILHLLVSLGVLSACEEKIGRSRGYRAK